MQRVGKFLTIGKLYITNWPNSLYADKKKLDIQ